MKLSPAERNTDIWWDSDIVFVDERYVFKRDMDMGPALHPWLIPHSEQVGCPEHAQEEVLSVPQTTKAGASLNDYYDFSIAPDSILFYHHKTGAVLFEPFAPFLTRDLSQIVKHTRKEMEAELLPGFDKRDHNDPVPQYKGIRNVVFKDVFYKPVGSK
jgi:hypothetical protein